jgi:outer membrane protein OmpA-like peptidoglycan-associated protein
MKFLWLSSLCLVGFFESSSFHVAGALQKITLNGKVTCDYSGVSVPSRLTISAQGISSIELETDKEGKFSAAIPATLSTCNIVVRAPGFELQEQELAIRNLKADSTFYIAILLTPIEKLKLSGMILDKKTNQPVNAEFDLYFDNDFVKQDVKIATDGKYEEVLTNYGWYLIDISAKGYLNTADTIWVLNDNRHDMHRDFYMTPFEAGMTVRLKNIQFTFGKTSLDPNSFNELNSVAEMLSDNPTLQLEIGGHTDNEGPEDYNLILSQGRAQAVVDYLISQGAKGAQLAAKGYGESKPIAPGETKEAKAMNRRVEFTILKN